MQVPNSEIGTAKQMRPETNKPMTKVEVKAKIKTAKNENNTSFMLPFSVALA